MPKTEYTLSSQKDILSRFSEIISNSPEHKVSIEVRESKAFEVGKWLPLGEITLSPSSFEDNNEEPIPLAITNGAFTWAVLPEEKLRQDFEQCKNTQIKSEDDDTAVQSISVAIQNCCRRLLLTYPTFDADTLSDWPLVQPITIVTDTSAVIQGALDFVSRFLCPMARLKVPAIVSLEILNQADNFLTLARKAQHSKQLVRCLEEHIKSQGGQRALLRVELRSDTEIERPVQGSDPIRAIYKKDDEIKDLNLSAVHKSLADRLIFETAKEHQSRVASNHPIYLLTSDQGLARMALSEGIAPIYFEARKTSNPLGRTLTGVNYHPFDSTLVTTSLTEALWELAVCFGSARIYNANREEYLEVHAFGGELNWYPYHSREDLLWCKWHIPPRIAKAPLANEINEEKAIDVPLELEDMVAIERQAAPAQVQVPESEPDLPIPAPNDLEPITAERVLQSRVAFYDVSPNDLLQFMQYIVANTMPSIQEYASLLNLKESSLSHYARFLVSGEFIQIQDNILTKLPGLDALAKAINEEDTKSIATELIRLPSIKAFVDFCQLFGMSSAWREIFWIKRKRSVNPVKSLAEMGGLILEIPEQGIIYTNEIPSLEVFANIAFNAYNLLRDSGEEYVLTGSWLECLALDSKIHPLHSRRLLTNAMEHGLIRCLIEGSTPDRRFEDHTLDTITVPDGVWEIRQFHLYQGDFLFPNRAAVRIRLER